RREACLDRVGVAVVELAVVVEVPGDACDRAVRVGGRGGERDGVQRVRASGRYIEGGGGRTVGDVDRVLRHVGGALVVGDLEPDRVRPRSGKRGLAAGQVAVAEVAVAVQVPGVGGDRAVRVGRARREGDLVAGLRGGRVEVERSGRRTVR